MFTSILFLILISYTRGDFDIKLKYCRLKCGCGNTNTDGESNEPSDFYWRDFYGTIPADAFPLGVENQFPQTYIGLVFDPLNNGTFVTTIVDGLDYVYNTHEGEVYKKTKRIQILCTMELERLVWMTLTADNVSSVAAKYLFVTAGVHPGINEAGVRRLNTFFVVKSSKCKVDYATSIASLYAELEYAAMDGTLQKSKEKMFLLYEKKNSQSKEGTKPNGKNKSAPFISHRYKYSTRGGSIIPNFYKQLNFGSCSIICTNEGRNKRENQNDNIKTANAMKYYWKPNVVLNKEEAIIVGANRNTSEYVGQAYSAYNWFDVGESTGQSVLIGGQRSSVSEDIDVHILSSDHNEKFEWISTTADKFATLDRTRMIPGGELDNGTETFVGRELSPNVVATSVRLFGSIAYSYSMFGPYGTFEILMIKEDKEK